MRGHLGGMQTKRTGLAGLRGAPSHSVSRHSPSEIDRKPVRKEEMRERKTTRLARLDRCSRSPCSRASMRARCTAYDVASMGGMSSAPFRFRFPWAGRRGAQRLDSSSGEDGIDAVARHVSVRRGWTAHAMRRLVVAGRTLAALTALTALIRRY